jgi:biopolymer transport protein ExbD
MRNKAVVVPEPQPFSQMNTTPLIDVLLVLLIMLILTIPMVTHKVPVDLPASGRAAAEIERHRLTIATSGALAWDGAPIAEPALPARLAALRSAGALLELETAPEARYERFDQVLATIKRAGVERLGFVGNARFERGEGR